jgi:hypothetical protein
MAERSADSTFYERVVERLDKDAGEMIASRGLARFVSESKDDRLPPGMARPVVVANIANAIHPPVNEDEKILEWQASQFGLTVGFAVGFMTDPDEVLEVTSYLENIAHPRARKLLLRRGIALKHYATRRARRVPQPVYSRLAGLFHEDIISHQGYPKSDFVTAAGFVLDVWSDAWKMQCQLVEYGEMEKVTTEHFGIKTNEAKEDDNDAGYA